MATPARPTIRDRQLAFLKVLQNQDELGAVIRAHIHIEHELIAFIRARIFPTNAADVLSLDYQSRVKLALAAGLRDEFKKPLNFVGTLRNRFAHKLGASVGKEDANNFRKALSSESRKIAEEALRSTNVKIGTSAKNKKIQSLDPIEQCALYFVTLWSAVAVAAEQAEKVRTH